MIRSLRLLFLLVLLLKSAGVRADRVVLLPDGGTLAPEGIKWEFALSPYRRNENLSWVQFSTPQQIEFEYNRFDLRGDVKLRNSLNVQYPLLTDLGSIPAVSVGVRDLFATGVERQALYLAAGKSIPLSDRQLRWFREFRLSAGVGTGFFGGPFVGVQARLRSGLQIHAEWYRKRPNISLGLPLVRNLQAKVYNLDGGVYYGLTFTLAR